MGGIKAQCDCVKALSESVFYDDLAIINVPVLVMHGEDDQIAPFAATAAKSIKLLKHGTLKVYPGFPHGMPTTNADQINADILRIHHNISGPDRKSCLTCVRIHPGHRGRLR
jgi:non-heme chloroperoxidase